MISLKIKLLLLVIILCYLTWLPMPVSGQVDTTILTVSWNSDGTYIAQGGTNGLLFVKDNEGEILNLDGHTGRILNVEWSPDGTKLASAGDDMIVRVWNISDPNYDAGQLITEFKGHRDIISSLAWNPVENILVSTTRNETLTFRAWDTATFEPDPILKASFSNIFEARWNRDGTKIALASEVGVFIFEWPIDIDNLQLADHLHGDFSYATAIAWNSIKDTIAVGKADGTVYFLNTKTFQIDDMFQAHKKSLLDIEWSPDFSELITISLDGTLKRWNTKNLTLIETRNVDTGNYIYQASWNPSGFQYAFIDAGGRFSTQATINMDDLDRKISDCISNEVLQATLEKDMNSKNWQGLINAVQNEQLTLTDELCRYIIIEMVNALAN